MSDRLREQFQGIGAVAPPEPTDRAERVATLVRRRARRNRVLAATAVAVAVAGSVAVWHGVRSGGEERLSPADGHALRLAIDLRPPLRPGGPVSLVARLTGEGAAATRYGFVVQWGDGSTDRAYGSTCPPATPTPVEDVRSYGHVYARPGSYAVRVVVTKCSVEQVSATASVVVHR
jgi:hypothetical protein